MISSPFAVLRCYPLAWLQGVFLGLACLLASCGGNSGDVTAVPGPRTAAMADASGSTVVSSMPVYTATIISAGGEANAGFGRKNINSSGQVAFLQSDREHGISRAVFYDGTSIHEIAGLRSGTAITSLNDAGQVVGFTSFDSGSGISHAFLWSKEKGMIDLGTLGGAGSIATDINASGQVTGFSQIDGDASVSHGFIWTQETGMVDIGVLGGTVVRPSSINENGQVTGTAWLPRTSPGLGGFRTHAFIWSPATRMSDLGTLGGLESEGVVINSAGQIAGRSLLPDGSTTHSFFWYSDSGMIDVGKLGGFYSTPVDMNASGTIVGNSTVNDVGKAAPYIWRRETGMQLLPSLLGLPAGEVRRINSAGFAVGYSPQPDTVFLPAVLWTPDRQIVDLNTRLVSPPPGLQVFTAYDINDKGMILARSANQELVLLRPVTNAPVISAFTALSPAQAGTSVQASLTWTDADAEQAYQVKWDWGDGSVPQSTSVSTSAGAGNAAATHVYAAAGIYTLKVTVTDAAGLTASTSREVAVFSAAGEFVTAGGWFDSPAGANRQTPQFTSRAMLALVGRYPAGATTPRGTMRFWLQGGELSFESREFHWMVVQGARVDLQGTGRVNGEEEYLFRLSVVDGKGGSQVDRAGIRIWQPATATAGEAVRYDNLGLPSTPLTPLHGGSVVLHVH